MLKLLIPKGNFRMGNGFESHPLKWKRPLAKRTEKYNYSWKSFALFCVIKYVAPFVNLPTDFSLIAICYLLIHVIKCGIITMNWIKVHSLFQDKTLVALNTGVLFLHENDREEAKFNVPWYASSYLNCSVNCNNYFAFTKITFYGVLFLQDLLYTLIGGKYRNGYL